MDAKQFLDGAVAEAEEVFNADMANEFVVNQFWRFQDTARALVNALRKTVGQNEQMDLSDPNMIDAFYNEVGSDSDLDITIDNFSSEQIDIISKSAYPSYLFALYVIKGRFPKGEASIARHPYLWSEYEWIVSKLDQFK